MRRAILANLWLGCAISMFSCGHPPRHLAADPATDQLYPPDPLDPRGAYRALVVVIQFADDSDSGADWPACARPPCSATSPEGRRRPSWIDQLVAPNAGLVSSWFQHVSRGRFQVSGDVFPFASDGVIVPGPWVHPAFLSTRRAFYEARGHDWVHARLIEAIDRDVDFARYDGDRDGQVDLVIFLYRDLNCGAYIFGSGREICSGVAQSGLLGFPTEDGVVVSRGVTMAAHTERSARHGLIHEIMHNLRFRTGEGVPDLYDTDQTSSGVSRYDVMASGLTASPFITESLGWSEPRSLSETDCDVRLGDWWSTRESLRIDTGEPGQYFLISFHLSSEEPEVAGAGLLIWHVDGTVRSNRNETHKLLDVESAAGMWNGAGVPDPVEGLDPIDANPSNASGADLFGPGQVFADHTNPSSRLHDRDGRQTIASGIAIDHIQALEPGETRLRFAAQVAGQPCP